MSTQEVIKEKKSLETWDGLLINYLKADNLEGQEEMFICTNARIIDGDLALNLERNGEKFIFSLNVTNKVFLKNNGIDRPRGIIGKKVFLKKVLAYNPTAKKEVDSLRIFKVE